MDWIKTEEKLPPFGRQVLVYCRIYGRYIGSYERLDENCEYGNWHDGEKLGVLPPTHWMFLPPAPHNNTIHEDGESERCPDCNGLNEHTWNCPNQ